MKVLIVGGGIAGPVLGVALARVGIQAELFERSETPERSGSWLTFQANGMDALRSIGLSAPVEALGYPVDTLSFVNGKGRRLGAMPMAARRTDGLTSRLMPRAALYNALGAQARAHGVEVTYGKQFVSAERGAGGVTAHFSDGSSARGDLLVGADGIHSTVRTLIDPDATRPRYVPVLNIGGFIPEFSVDVPAREFRMQFGTRCFFGWAPTPDGGTVWFANPPMLREPGRGEVSGIDDAEWRRRLHALVGNDAGPMHDVIDRAPGPLFGWPTYDLPVVRHWHDGHGRMVVIGDAAHATSPASGQGASMALEDAVMLARCLRDVKGAAAALSTFEALRRDRTERIVKEGHRSSASKAAGPLGRIIRDLMLPMIFSRVAKDDGASMMWLQGHHIDFAAPVQLK